MGHRSILKDGRWKHAFRLFRQASSQDLRRMQHRSRPSPSLRNEATSSRQAQGPSVRPEVTVYQMKIFILSNLYKARLLGPLVYGQEMLVSYWLLPAQPWRRSPWDHLAAALAPCPALSGSRRTTSRREPCPLVGGQLACSCNVGDDHATRGSSRPL